MLSQKFQWTQTSGGAGRASGNVLNIQMEADELAYQIHRRKHRHQGPPDSPCYRLEEANEPAEGAVPLWGQTGEFIVTVRRAKVSVEMDGMYGIGAMAIRGFSANVVEPNKPFIAR
jgi:hypothetical protein